MSTPSGPPQGDQPGSYPGQQPYTGPYGTGYGGAQYGTPPPQGQEAQQGGPPHGSPQYGSPQQEGGQYRGQQYGAAGQPYGGGGGYPYSPYGSGADLPAGLDEQSAVPAPRPPIMIAALVLLLLSTLPWLLIGVSFLLAPGQIAGLAGEIRPADQANLDELGLTVEVFVQFFGWLVLGLVLLFAAFAVLAFLRRNWARIVVTVMTGVFLLSTLFLMVLAGAVDLQSGATVLAAIAGVVLMFLGPSNRFFASPRR